MNALEQPLLSTNESERVAYASPHEIEHVPGEIPSEDLVILTQEFTTRIGRNPQMSPQEYAAVAECLLNECHEDCRVDPLYHTASTLPSLSDEQCNYFLDVAISLAYNIRSRDFGHQLEAYLFPGAEEPERNVLRAILYD